ncbi:hypothetical protein BDV06DRAFT_222244 [Aspergillus oleicola]
MSSELDAQLALLGRSHTTTQLQSHLRERGSLSSTKEKLVELRPKGSVVLVAPGSPMQFKRKQHAQAQKQQRDRMRAALDRIAATLEGAGDRVNVNAGTGGTKAELVEAAVEYIQSLQGQIEQLRGAGHATG